MILLLTLTSLQTDAFFTDFSKSFDKVPHKRLINKLIQLHIHPALVTWISEFLIILSSNLSSCRPIISDVTQGNLLGLLIFLIHINDIPDQITSSIRLFDDDSVVYRPISRSNDHIALKGDLNNSTKWCNTWQIYINASKTNLLSFTRAQTTSHNYSIYHRGTCWAYKYIGVHVTNDLSWKTRVSIVITKANCSWATLVSTWDRRSFR